MKYDKKLGYQIKKCEVCGEIRQCCQHHIGHRRYSAEAIWVDDICHAKIHADPAWAYEQGYLIRHNTFYKIKMKEPRKKGCSHSKTMYDARLGYIRCNYCGQKVDNLNFGAKKKEPKDHSGGVTQKVRMGYEPRDSRVDKAEAMKRRMAKLTIEIKQSANDKVKFEALKIEKDKLKAEMLNLQSTFED